MLVKYNIRFLVVISCWRRRRCGLGCKGDYFPFRNQFSSDPQNRRVYRCLYHINAPNPPTPSFFKFFSHRFYESYMPDLTLKKKKMIDCLKFFSPFSFYEKNIYFNKINISFIFINFKNIFKFFYNSINRFYL